MSTCKLTFYFEFLFRDLAQLVTLNNQGINADHGGNIQAIVPETMRHTTNKTMFLIINRIYMSFVLNYWKVVIIKL